MSNYLAVTALLAAGLIGMAAPAFADTAAVLNGDFTGATYPAWHPTQPGQIVLPTYNFGAHSYVDTFGWSNTGSGALSYIAAYGAQIQPHDQYSYLFAPANPAGYAGYIYAADASPDFNGGTYLLQSLQNLTIGQRYTVSFQQASGSEYQIGGDTAQWIVGWGGATAYGPFGPGGGDTTVLNGATTEASQLMTNAADGTSPWSFQSMTFTAQHSTELLSFFANGSGAPPFALLADVSISAVPEPATWAMMIAGFGLVGVAMRRRRARDGAVAFG